MKSRRQTKAGLLLAQLDEARCNGDWEEVEDLSRKVAKYHGPKRQCLSLTAHTEFELVKYMGLRLLSNNVPTSSIADLVTPLSRAVDAEKSHAEDGLQGQVCLAWVHRTLNEPSRALSRLPADPVGQWSNLPGAVGHPPTWTMVCIFRAVHIIAASQKELGKASEALDTLATALPLVSRFTYHSASVELRKWIERVLVEGCLLSNVIASSGQPLFTGDPGTPLNFYRGWSSFWKASTGDNIQALGGPSARSGVLRREIWQAYYLALSSVLQQARPVPSFLATEPPSPAFATSPSRPPPPNPMSQYQQRVEIQRAQDIYEGLVLREVTFPKADERSTEVDEWVEAVMGNWATFCGNMWREEELGEGGREGMTRGILDILYRAATKTFHSTPILRFLFTVHLALGEFELAFKALDTYLEVVTKGKSRVEKSGDEEPGLDSDDMMISTAGEGVKALCAYGERRHAERAREIGTLILKWLSKHEPTPSDLGTAARRASMIQWNYQRANDLPSVSPSTLAGGHRAVGISLAHWARISYDSQDQAASRFQFRTDALVELRTAVSPELQDEDNLESQYALGLLLAEMRDTNGALAVVKQALTPRPSAMRSASVATLDPSSAVTQPVEAADPDRERKMLPLWHLLALILSARQDFTTAAKTCEAGLASVPLPDPAEPRPQEASFSNGDLNGSTRHFFSEKARARAGATADRMNTTEKEILLQTKMTQLTLLEISEGADVALDSSEELLALYSRLFGSPQLDRASRPATRIETSEPPKSSAGTIRNSIRGTLMGRPKSKRQSLRQLDTTRPGTVDSSYTSLQGAQTPKEPRTPAIQVTDEDTRSALSSKPEGHRYSFHHGEKQREKLQKRGTTGSLGHKKSVNSFMRRKRTPVNSIIDTDDDDVVMNGSSDGGYRDSLRASVAPTEFSEKVESTSHETWKASRHPRNSITPSQVGIAVSGDPVPEVPTTPTTQHQPSGLAAQPLNPEPYNLPTSRAPPPFGQPGQPPAQDVRLPTASTRLVFNAPDPQFPRLEEGRLRTGLLVKVWLLIAGLYRRARLFEDAHGAIDEAAKLLAGLERAWRAALKDAARIHELMTGAIGGLGQGSIAHLLGDLYAERAFLARSEATPFLALEHFETALSHFPDHPAATVGLCTILLDVASGALHPPSTTSSLASLLASLSLQPPAAVSVSGAPHPLGFLSPLPAALPAPSPATDTELDRLAARDRAYVLLLTLTDSGAGWDSSEAWFVLARALELSGLQGKASEALWWCVQLEEGRPVRAWGEALGGKGFVL